MRSRPTADERASYWQAARGMLAGQAGGGLNIAQEAVDRYAASRPEVVALRWLGRHGEQRDVTYRALGEVTNRFANVLATLGVSAGDAVFVLLGRVPELHTVVLGSLKHKAVVCPLFSAFGPEPVRQRMQLGSARVLVTSRALYDRKVAPVRADLPSLRHVLLTDVVEDDRAAGLRSLPRLLDEANCHYEVPSTDVEEPALLHFTSGTTGAPKGVVHVHEAVVAHHVTGRDVLDLHSGDVFWCAADPGWVTGTSYGIVSPLTNGVTIVVDEAEFDVERWYSILEREHVTVWYTAPTAIRMLMRAGGAAVGGHDLSALRVIASVGEPLNPEAVRWGRAAYGLDILDNWWQTETGGIMIANRVAQPVKLGSMGTPLPGVEAAVLRRDDQGVVRDADGAPQVAATGAEGELALRAGWPSMFRGYLGMEERYRACFAGGWYLTGDLARVDDDGYFWFVGRGDDVIKSAGHLIGPFEVESALMEHPAVAEAGVVGVPDALLGNVVKAFVVLKPGRVDSDELRRDIMAHARRRLGAAIAPREIAARPELPRTRSGKIMRRLLRARELGLPEGDLSTLEANSAAVLATDRCAEAGA